MLLICSVTVSLIAIVFYFFFRLLRRYSARCLYHTWIIIIIAYIIPLRPILDYRAYRPISPTAAQKNITNLVTYTHATGNILTPSSNLFIDYNWALGIWAIGFISVIAFHIIRHFYLVKLVQHCGYHTTSDQNITEVLQQVSAELGISKRIPVQICPRIDNPLLFGFLQPKILLPTENYSIEELTFIFKHELIHYKRKDLWLNALTTLATAIHWFNPVIYFAVRSFQLQCELSCDKEVIYKANRDARQQYGNLIMLLAQQRKKPVTSIFTKISCIKTKTERRILSILSTRKKRTGIAVTASTFLFIILAGAIFSGYAYPSMRYFKMKWETNMLQNEKVYKSEPNVNDLTEHSPFMDSIIISFIFKPGKAPSWLNTASNYQAKISTYDAVVMKGVDFSNKEETAAFADYQLLVKYHSMENKGFADKKPEPSAYTYKIEIPEGLNNYQVTDFYKNSDLTALPEWKYFISYSQDGTVFSTSITQEDLKMRGEDIKEAAKKEVLDFAKENGITLPENFQDHIQIYQN